MQKGKLNPKGNLGIMGVNQIYHQMKLNRQIDLNFKPDTANAHRTLEQISKDQKFQFLKRTEKRMFSQPTDKQNIGPGSYSYQEKKTQFNGILKMNSKRDFPHQQGSYSSLSPGHYEYKELMPKQSYCMKGTFGNQEKLNIIEGQVALNLDNPSVGIYNTDYVCKKQGGKSYSFSKNNIEKKCKRTQSLKIVANTKLSENENIIIRKQTHEKLGTANFQKKTVSKMKKKVPPVLDHRKYNNILDWSKPRNILKIQSKGPQPNIYY